MQLGDQVHLSRAATKDLSEQPEYRRMTDRTTSESWEGGLHVDDGGQEPIEVDLGAPTRKPNWELGMAIVPYLVPDPARWSDSGS